MKEPFLYTGEESIELSVSEIFQIVKSVIESGQEELFIAAAIQENVKLMVPPDTVNFGKKNLFHYGIHKLNLVARNAITSETCDRPRRG